MYIPEGEEVTRHAYKSKYNLSRKNKVILLIITDGKKWHYLTVRRLGALLRGVTSKHEGDFYCLNCSHSYASEKSLEKHMKLCEDKDYCYIEMTRKGEKLKHTPGIKSMKSPYVIYADTESYLKN